MTNTIVPSLVISFVHGYQNLNILLQDIKRPALWRLTKEKSQVYSYYFPRNPSDFYKIEDVHLGQKPFSTVSDFRTLPRFGFTGLSRYNGHIYAGSWNGVYVLDESNLEWVGFISNTLTNDLHGILADDIGLWTILTPYDTLVLNDYNGHILNTWTINRDLGVERYQGPEVDWRFVGKQFRGSCGFFHFNFIRREGNKIWLTSRSCNALIVLDLLTEECTLRLMNLCTPSLLHDGVKIDSKIYFTSIDGKIIIAEDAVDSGRTAQETVPDLALYRRDFAADLIRINETDYGKEPNWCRGFARRNDINYVTIDGRYDTELSFGVLGIDDGGKVYLNRRLNFSEIGDESELRYVSGFSLICMDGAPDAK